MSKFLLRGGCVLTLGARTTNLPEGDVLIDGGVIAEVGVGLRARDAEVIEASDSIVMPGFVDAHRHTWASLFRNLGQTSAPSTAASFGADDVYASTLVGLLGAIEAGITTVADWFDLPAEGDGLAEAALQAHTDAGLQTVFVHATREASLRKDGAAVSRLLSGLAAAAGPSTTVAFGSDAFDPVERPEETWPTVRDAACRIHVHAALRGARAGAVASLGERGLLGPDVTLVHWAGLDDADLDAVSAAGACVCLSPSGEMAGGFGMPPIQRFIDRDLRIGLGVGHEWMAPGDLFAQMRSVISMQHAMVFDRKLAGKASLPKMMTTRDAIRSGTVDGARSLGLGATTGTIEPGRRADLIVLKTDRANIHPINDAIGAVVWGMDTSNIGWVFSGGRALVREGFLEADVARVRGLVAEAQRRVVPAEAISGAAS